MNTKGEVALEAAERLALPIKHIRPIKLEDEDFYGLPTPREQPDDVWSGNDTDWNEQDMFDEGGF